MHVKPRRNGGIRAILASVVAAALSFGSSGVPLSAQPTATFSGWILGTDGKPAEGLQVVLRDADSAKEYVSAKSGAAGDYTMSVPVGPRYVLASVIAPDGSLLSVQQIPPIAVKVPGNNRLDVRFAGVAGGGQGGAAGTSEAGVEKKGGTPWWKTPGGIVGIVVGVGAVAAFAAGGGGSDSPPQQPVSPANNK